VQIRTKIGIVAVALLTTLSSIMATYAILNTVTLTDTVSISDRTPSPRSSVEDTLDFSENAENSNQQVDDVLLPNDGSGIYTAITDNASPSDSVVATSNTYHLVSVTSTFDLSDRSNSGMSTLDAAGIGEAIGEYTSAGADALLLLDSISRTFFVLLTETLLITDRPDTEQASSTDEGEDGDEQDDNGGGGRGPSNLLYDESYFSENPLERFQVRSLQLLNSQGSAFTVVKQGEAINLTLLFKNYQKYNQSYVLLVQMEDEDTGYTKDILQSSGWLDRAKTTTATVSWIPEEAGTCKLKVMIWSGLDKPIPLTESISRSLVVTES